MRTKRLSGAGNARNHQFPDASKTASLEPSYLLPDRACRPRPHRRPRRHLLLGRSAVVRLARLRARLLEDLLAPVGNLRSLCGGHVSRPLRRLPRSRPRPSGRSAGNAHHLLRRPTRRAARGKGPAYRRPHRRADRLRRHRLRYRVAMAHAGALLVCACDGRKFRRSHLRPPARFLSLHLAGLGAHRRLAAHAGRARLDSRRALPRRRRRRTPAQRSVPRFRFIHLARRIHCRGFSAPHAGHSRVRRPLRSPLRIAHHLLRRHLHRRTHHADRHVVHQRGALARGGDCLRRRPAQAARALAAGGHRSRGSLLDRGRRGRMVREHLHRQTQPARPRAALHRRQHRPDAPGLRPRRLRPERVPR